MKFNNIIKTISCLLIMLTLVSLFGCVGKTTDSSSQTNSTAEELLLDQLADSGEMPEDVEENINDNSGKIMFSSPQQTDFTVYDSYVYFNGICNVGYPLTINGNEQTVGDDGYFTVRYDLQQGENEIKFSNGEFEEVYRITYKQPLIKSYTPRDSALSLDGGSPLSITAVAKSGSTVIARYNGKTIALNENGEPDGLYSTYKAVVTTAKSGSSTIEITATKGTDTQTVTASKITIKSKSTIVYNSSPIKSLQNKGYAEVGNQYVAEVVGTTAEGFLGGTVDDYSRPTVNYLPKGTVDYCSPSKIYDSESGKKYYLLRNNVRVYSKKSNVKVYKGKLPTKNNLEYTSSEISDKHLLLNFKVDWKAPFRFVLGKQGYKSEKAQDYEISSPTFSYIDITFCYSDSLKNFKLIENPIFKSYEITKGDKDYTLRLYLKNTGKFWGWNAKYTSTGELQFSFLCPSTIQKADNQYGYSLKGIKITVDAGHGGKESGTYNAVNSPYYEKDYNLLYAKALANELLKLGATVYMPRTEDKTLSLAKRYDYITATNADLAISVHFNGSQNGSTNGYFMGYFNPYTFEAAKSISKSIASTGLISAERDGLDWHYFNLSRVSACPVVLTENGYLTGVSDYKKIKTSAFRVAYIEGMVQGIVNYFAQNSGYAVVEKAPSSQTATPSIPPQKNESASKISSGISSRGETTSKTTSKTNSSTNFKTTSDVISTSSTPQGATGSKVASATYTPTKPTVSNAESSKSATSFASAPSTADSLPSAAGSKPTTSIVSSSAQSQSAVSGTASSEKPQSAVSIPQRPIIVVSSTPSRVIASSSLIESSSSPVLSSSTISEVSSSENSIPDEETSTPVVSDASSLSSDTSAAPSETTE